MSFRQAKRIKLFFLGTTACLVALAWHVLFQSRAARPDTSARLSGWTMGTSYSITFHPNPGSEERAQLARAVEDELRQVSRLFSTFDPESEISRFNDHASTRPFPVSPAFAELIGLALEMAQLTGGAFDPTVAPLVDLWGFGASKPPRMPPEEELIRDTLSQTGWQHLTLRTNLLTKALPGLRLDLGAIAKGHGVDRLSDLLAKRGHVNHVIEIGGDTRARGQRPDGSPWRVGLQRPDYAAAHGHALLDILPIDNRAVASSGDSQQLSVADDGTVLSHIIDPRTGYPVRTPLASVTVLADLCAVADALATALFVMPPAKGKALIETLDDVEALFVLRHDDNTFSLSATSGMPLRATPEK